MDDRDRQRLTDLLRYPGETLDVEVKPWLDTTANGDKSKIAKALIALANHGGGYLLLGHEEREDKTVAPDPARPVSLVGYSTDAINAIVARYAEPEFHCTVALVDHPDTAEAFPIVRVPGGQTSPIRAKRHGESIQRNTYYIRRPGPKSEAPQSGREWDELLQQCIRNGRERLLEAIRVALGDAQAVRSKEPSLEDKLEEWERASLERWRAKTADLPESAAARFPHGHYRASYLVQNPTQEPDLSDLPDLLARSVARHSGWPPFWVPTRPGITPYPFEGAVECWIDPEHTHFPDPGHTDFWRASPDGRMFLIRGFQEDGQEQERHAPGAVLDVAIPIYRIAEVLLHAEKLTTAFGGDGVTLKVAFEGLQGRALASISGRRSLQDHYVAQQDTFSQTAEIGLTQLRDNLAEVLRELLSDLYSSFRFFKLSPRVVNEILEQVHGNAQR